MRASSLGIAIIVVMVAGTLVPLITTAAASTMMRRLATSSAGFLLPAARPRATLPVCMFASVPNTPLTSEAEARRVDPHIKFSGLGSFWCV